MPRVWVGGEQSRIAFISKEIRWKWKPISMWFGVASVTRR